MSSSWEEYQIEFLTMISELADDFTDHQCKKLSFVYQNMFTTSFRDKYANDPLNLLNYLLNERKMFSFDKPENLAAMMEKLEFTDKRDKVELFIDKHRKSLSSLLVKMRALPPTPEPIQEEAERNYVTIDVVPFNNSIGTTTTALPMPGNSPTVIFDDQRLNSEYAQTALSHTALSRKSRSLPMLLAESGCSSDDEDSIYEEINTRAIKHISHETPPLLIERMMLSVSQLRELVEKRSDNLLESEPFDCPVLNFRFMLEVNPSVDKSVSAKVYLFEDLSMHMKTLYFTDKYYLVELKVSQSTDKRAPKPGYSNFNIYSISKVIDKLPAESKDQTDGSQSISRGSSDAKSHKKRICVATFPEIISHKNLMDQILVTKSYLILTFTFKHQQVV